MKRKMLLVCIVFVASAAFIQSCQVNGCSRGDMNSNGRQNEDDGRKMKGNCMQCHGPNGGGRGCFTIGGTVYDSTQLVPNANAVIMFYTQPNGGGLLVATLDVDASGNFYTTSVINFGSGLYPVVRSTISNKVQYMPSSTVNGACGSCHGIANAKIWIN